MTRTTRIGDADVSGGRGTLRGDNGSIRVACLWVDERSSFELHPILGWRGTGRDADGGGKALSGWLGRGLGDRALAGDLRYSCGGHALLGAEGRDAGGSRATYGVVCVVQDALRFHSKQAVELWSQGASGRWLLATALRAAWTATCVGWRRNADKSRRALLTPICPIFARGLGLDSPDSAQLQRSCLASLTGSVTLDR